MLDRRPLWLLDEPFTALDANGREQLLAMVGMHRQSGGAVVAAIHGDAGFAASREVTL